MAQQYFQLVGASASECDTIPGRLVRLTGPGRPARCGRNARIGAVHRTVRDGSRESNLLFACLPQCMAMCFFLLKQFEDVLIYLKSVKTYFYNDDDFNFNYAMAKSATGNYKDAEELLLVIQNERCSPCSL